MDGRKFDRWTQILTDTSRRDAIKFLITGLATGSLAAGSARDTIAQVEPLACGRDGDSCNERNGNRDCCSGFKCKNDRCRSKDNNNRGGCGEDGDSCDERNGNRDCCSGFKCKNDRCRSKDNDNGGCGRDGDDCRNRGCCKGFRCKNDRCRKK
jgi:hypothetical protein